MLLIEDSKTVYNDDVFVIITIANCASCVEFNLFIFHLELMLVHFVIHIVGYQNLRIKRKKIRRKTLNYLNVDLIVR